MADAMLPVALAEVTDPLHTGDEMLTADELKQLSIFDGLKKGLSFDRFPGTTILRRCEKGRVLVRQGAAGATAYTILTTQDVIKVRESQLGAVKKLVTAKESNAPAEAHQYFNDLSLADLKQKQRDIETELVSLKKRQADFDAANTPPNKRPVASAHLLLGGADNKPKGLLHRFQRMFSGGSKSKNPAFIPIDGPADMDANTRRIPLHESELFGEMSCMNRAPRSATVLADTDCYMLEMLRNVLDMLHKDPVYQKKLDEVYRERVLDGHVRRLSIFEDIPDADFAALRGRLELVEKQAGDVIFEEGEESDSFYVIRSGLVKVVKNAWTFFRANEFNDTHWASLAPELLYAAREHVGSMIWAKLSADVRATLEASAKTPIPADKRDEVIAGLNDLVRNGTVHTQLGKAVEDVIVEIDSPQVAIDCEHFPEETEKWSELERRTFTRSLLEFLCPAGIPRRAASSGARRILRYMGRGETFGELGVITGANRSATIFAYDHPDGGASQRLPDSRTGAVVSRTELVKLSKADFLHIVNQSPRVKAKVEAMIANFQRPASAGSTSGHMESLSQSPEFEDLGLIQGQKLMLIDLDRCTRCGQCVEACVAAHDDGRTRLYLDGPRFEKYLVPLTCRSCMDPVCMIGCPVGAINRGDNGEILIRDWCIGCSVCADQCPYGSIQMGELEGAIELTDAQKALLGDADVKPVTHRATVCDLCSSGPGKSPSCVYACPHDAAMRVNALDFFFTKS